MSNPIGSGITKILAIFIAIVVVIAALIALAATGVGGSATSTALTTTNTDIEASMGFIGILCAGGLVLWAMQSRS